MRNSSRSWFARRSARGLYGFSAAFAVVGVAWISDMVVADAGWSSFVVGAAWLTMAFSWFLMARQYHRREQLGGDQELPEAGQDVRTLLSQGRKIEAIKRYRQLHPGVGLREAKHVVDEL